MDPSSDPGRDDYGLPPVDVEIPDDARDLERDVLAYHRELRALRRRARIRRAVAPAARRSMLIPLIAMCFAVTLLSGTLLTVITGHEAAPAPSVATNSLPGVATTPAGRQPAPLPRAQVTLDGKQVPLHSLVPAVLAWVPQPCSCLAALRLLAKQAAQAHVAMYLVGTARAAQSLPALALQVWRRSSQVVNDTTNTIALTYRPIGLTAILARRDGTVGGVIRRLPAGDREVSAALAGLASRGPAASRGALPSSSQPDPQGT